MIEYKGYIGVFEYDPDIDAFHGEVVNTRDVITFQGSSVDELHQELAASVDDYLTWCEQEGREPDKPYRGEFLVRTTPEVHRLVSVAAAREGKSVNAWAAEVLERTSRQYTEVRTKPRRPPIGQAESKLVPRNTKPKGARKTR